MASAKITYLLGAGASCGSLPLAEQLGHRIIKSITMAQDEIRHIHGKGGQPFPEEKELWLEDNYVKNFLESLEWLGKYAFKHATVDTLARKFWVRQDNEATESLHRLKAVLSCYFLYEHSCAHSDKRYDSFFASILDRNKPGVPLFPDSISILTWNYDLLLEKSYYEFCADEEIAWNHITTNEKIVRLSGQAAVAVPDFPGTKKWREWEYIDIIYHPEEQHIERVIELYNILSSARGPNLLKPKIYFAWEWEDISEEIKKAAQNTEILVVIGYSFPFFNQDVDKLLLDQMSPTLKKIYLQTNGDIGGKERLLNILNVVPKVDPIARLDRIEMIGGTDYFYIPNEFKR